MPEPNRAATYSGNYFLQRVGATDTSTQSPVLPITLR